MLALAPAAVASNRPLNGLLACAGSFARSASTSSTARTAGLAVGGALGVFCAGVSTWLSGRPGVRSPALLVHLTGGVLGLLSPLFRQRVGEALRLEVNLEKVERLAEVGLVHDRLLETGASEIAVQFEERDDDLEDALRVAPRDPHCGGVGS